MDRRMVLNIPNRQQYSLSDKTDFLTLAVSLGIFWNYLIFLSLYSLLEPVFNRNQIFSVKISIPLENTGVSSVFATSVWPFSLIFSLARRNEGNFFQAVPTTLSSSLAEVRLASLVAWA